MAQVSHAAPLAWSSEARSLNGGRRIDLGMLVVVWPTAGALP
jgi:hypothetical protein